MRIMSLDYGDKNIGVAISDPFGWTAQGLEVIRRPNPQDVKSSLDRLEAIAAEYGVEAIVLGFPKNMNNTEGERCRLTLEFKKRLAARFPGISIILQDERMSSAFAERAMLEGDLRREKRKSLVDIGAAVFILQGYLDEQSKIKDNEVSQLADNKNDDLDKNEGQDSFESMDSMEDMLELITLAGDDGEEEEYIFIDEVEHNGAKYVLMVKSDDVDNDEADALIYKQAGDDGETVTYEEISDEEFEAVARILSEQMEDYDIEF